MTNLLTSEELAAMLGGIPVRTLDQWAYRKVGPSYVRCGRHRGYRIQDVERWLDSQTRGGTAA